MEEKSIRLKADRVYACAGDGSKSDRKHSAGCIGILTGDEYVERNAKTEGYGDRHCLYCWNRFFKS